MKRIQLFVLLGALAALSACSQQRADSYIADLTHPERQVRLNAGYQLVMMGDAAVEPLLQSLEATASDSMRYIGVQILGRIGNDDAVPYLRGLLAAPNPFVRREAALALGKMGDPALILPLATLLGEDPAPEVRAAAAQSLPNFRDSTAAGPLVEALADTASKVRAAALAGLDRLWPRQIEAAILPRLADDDETVRYIAVQILGKHRVKAGLDGLCGALQDSSVWVRTEAARALGRLRDQEAVPPLTRLLKRHDGPDAEAARRALRDITGMDYVVLEE